MDWQERVRQFNEQLAESRRQQEASRLALSALTNQANNSVNNAQNAANNILKTYNNTAGQITGYETPTKSQLTDVGMKQLDDEIRRTSRNFLGNIFGGVGDLTGWW